MTIKIDLFTLGLAILAAACAGYVSGLRLSAPVMPPVEPAEGE